MKKFLSLLMTLAMVFALTSALAEERITAYGAYQEDELQFLFNAFEKETGVKVYYVRLSASELYTRIQAEAENPQASLWFGTSVDTLNVAAAGGYLDQYAPNGIEHVPESLRDPNGYWTPHSLSVLCFASNTAWLEETGLPAPTSWQDLLDEKYADNVVVAHPGTSGVAYAWLSSMVSLMGEDEAIEYMKKLDKNIVQYSKGGAAPARMAGLGESGIGLCWSCDAMNTINAGYPLTLTYPEEGSPYEITGMALIHNGPAAETENAKKFMDWAISKETQELYVSTYYRLPVVDNAELPDGMVAFSEMNTIPVDRTFASENRTRLIARFESDVRGSDNVLK